MIEYARMKYVILGLEEADGWISGYIEAILCLTILRRLRDDP
jgi:hypothetical protein